MEKKAYPIRLQPEIMGQFRESAASAHLSQGDFLQNLLANYEFQIRHCYRIAGVDFKKRSDLLDSHFCAVILTVAKDGCGLDADWVVQELQEQGKDFNQPDTAWEPEFILPKGAK